MHALHSFNGCHPVVDATAYVHPSACVIGDVVVGAGCFVGPGAVLRGDHGAIRLEERSNVQDHCVLHSAPGGTVWVGPMAQVGHGAVLHGCRLLDNCLIGIHATVLDGAVVGASCIVAAQALVVARAQLEGCSLYLGSPARRARTLQPDEVAELRTSALHYVELVATYRMTELAALRLGGLTQRRAQGAAALPI